MKKVKFNAQRALSFFCVTVISMFIIIQFVRIFKNGSSSFAAPDWLFKDEVRDEYLSYIETAIENDFGDGKGIISIQAGNFSEGSIYVFINGCIEADLAGGETRTFRVAVGDVILAMGHNLLGNAEIGIVTAVGRIDCSIANLKISVGNKGKLLAVIKKYDI